MPEEHTLSTTEESLAIPYLLFFPQHYSPISHVMIYPILVRYLFISVVLSIHNPFTGDNIKEWILKYKQNVSSDVIHVGMV